MDPSIESLLPNIIKGFGLKDTALILIPFFYILAYILNAKYKKVNAKFYNIDDRYFEFYDIKKLSYIFLVVFAYIIIMIKLTYIYIYDSDIIAFLLILIINTVVFYLLGDLLNKYIYNKITVDNDKRNNYYDSDNYKKYNKSFLVSTIVILALFVIIKPLIAVKLTYPLLSILVIYSIVKYKDWEIKKEKFKKLNKIIMHLKKWNYSIVIGYSAIYFSIITWIAISIITSFNIASDFNSETAANIGNNISAKKADDTLSLKFSRITSEINEDIRNCNDWTIRDLYEGFFKTESLVTKAASYINKEQITSDEKIESEYKKYINPDPNKYIMLKLHPNGGTIEGDFVYWLRKGHFLTDKDLSNTRAIKKNLPLKYWSFNKNGFNSSLPLYVDYFGNINLYANYEDIRGVISGSEVKDIANKYIQHLEANNFKGKLFKMLRVLIILRYNNLGFTFQLLISFIILLAVTFIAIKELLFNPSNKKKYEYIELYGNTKYFIITEYNKQFLCMKENEDNTEKNVLYLDTKSIKLISPNDKFDINSIGYNAVGTEFKEDLNLEKIFLISLTAISLLVLFLVFIN